MPPPLRLCVTLLLAAGMTACGNPNGVAVRAQIASIDRKCSYKQIIGEFEGRPVTGGSGTRQMLPCDTTPDFEKLRKNPATRGKDIVGKAVVTVSFDSPVDKSIRTATLTLDGSDDAFYALHYGDTVDLMVDKTDTKAVWLPDS